MHILVDESGSPETLGRMLAEMDSRGDVGSMLVLAADGNGWTVEAIDPLLSQTGKPVFGGIFPAVIHDDRYMKTGTVVTGLKTEATPHLIPGLSAENADYESQLEKHIEESDSLRTMMVLVDGLSTRVGQFLEALYAVFGLEINYVGGGCGSLTFRKKPCLITPDGMVGDSALLVELETESGVGVAHGWRPVSTPYKATEVGPNSIRTLDWKPALEVYRAVVEPSAEEALTNENFFQHAANHPLGVAKMDAEMVVRDPYQHTEEGELLIVGNVPCGAYLYVLSATPEDLIKAAVRARDMAANALRRKGESALYLFMDCISREMLLKEKFNQEIEAVFTGKTPLVGACSMGEIANTGKEFLEIYNKTAVLALLEDV